MSLTSKSSSCELRQIDEVNGSFRKVARVSILSNGFECVIALPGLIESAVVAYLCTYKMKHQEQQGQTEQKLKKWACVVEYKEIAKGRGFLLHKQSHGAGGVRNDHDAEIQNE